MNRLKLFSITLFFCFFSLQVGAQTVPPAPEQNKPLSISSSEVLLDFVARDRKGNRVVDLKPEEVEIYEDGLKQTPTAFKFVEFENRQAATNAGELQQKKPRIDPSRPLRLITLAFDNLDVESRAFIRQAALDFVDYSLNDNVLIGIFVSGQRLYLLQQFTNDRAKLQAAIEKVVLKVERPAEFFGNETARQLNALAAADRNSNALGQVDFSAGSRGTNVPTLSTGTDVNGVPTDPAGLAIARFTLNLYRTMEVAERETQARLSIYPLIQLVREQKKLPGRKTLVYFSKGLVVPAPLVPAFQIAMSEANRANVSIYAVDARGLTTTVESADATKELNLAIRQSEDMRDSGGALARDSMSTFETGESSIRLNKLNTLNELATSTGGFLIANTNNLKEPLKRITNDLDGYYEVFYSPVKPEMDGRYRKLSVKVLRPGIKVQSRSGYYATKVAEVAPEFNPEGLLAEALNSEALPMAFPHRALPIRFAADPQSTKYLLAFEVPIAGLNFRTDTVAQTYETKLAFLSQIKNAKGEVVQRVQTTYPLQGKYTREEELKIGNLEFTIPLSLPSGALTVETALYNLDGKKLSAQRQTLNVEPFIEGIKTSALTIIKRFEAVKTPSSNNPNPLILPNGKIIPNLGEPLAVSAKQYIPLFLEIYSDPKSSDVVELTLEFYLDGKLVSRGKPELAAADATGKILSVTSIPTQNFRSGDYEVRAIVSSGNLQIVERTNFKLIRTDGAPIVKTAEAPKTIAQESKPDSDTEEMDLRGTGKLTEDLVRTESVAATGAPLDNIKPEMLLEDAARNGQKMYRRLLNYTYELKSTKRKLMRGGWVENEEAQVMEAYPVRTHHELVMTSNNGKKLPEWLLQQQRADVGKALEKDQISEQTKNQTSDQANVSSFITVGASGLEKGLLKTLAFDPAIIVKHSEFSAPRYEKIGDILTLATDFKIRSDAELGAKYDYLKNFQGTIWVEEKDKIILRIEGLPIDKETKTKSTKPGKTILFYEQQKIATGVWAPRLIRLNSGGKSAVFNGLNWDVTFEFGAFQKFNTTADEEKLTKPIQKK
jgi:VWFA-related protein